MKRFEPAPGGSDVDMVCSANGPYVHFDDLPKWTPVSERMPPSGQIVLGCYKNPLGHWRRIRVQWVAAKSVESSCESDIGEYDEDTDTYYDPEGWYERIDNWDDYSAVLVSEGYPTHWMPLPEPPEGV